MLRTLLIFGKLPIGGLVKTRLIDDYLNENDVTSLYECFLLDTLSLALETKCDNIYWFIYPEKSILAQEIIEKLPFPKRSKIRIKIQVGNNFGERFTHAFKTFEDASPQNIVVIGSDIPQLQPKTIETAFELLELENCIVIGPSPEGGFYLLGNSNSLQIDARNYFEKGFEVLNYLEFAQSRNIPMHLLEELSDVDIFSDLISLFCYLNLLKYASQFDKVHFPIRSFDYLKKLDLKEVSKSKVTSR